MGKRLSVVEAKAHFSDCLRSAEQGRPVVITRRGKPIAALVPADRLKQLERLIAAGPDGGLASLAGGWKGSEEFVAQLDRIKRSPPRRTPDLDE